MGKRGRNGNQGGLTLREESSGRKQIKGGSINAKSMLKLQHLQKLATWASGDASIPSLGAFFGHRFAAGGEALGVLPDPSLFPCQRLAKLSVYTRVHLLYFFLFEFIEVVGRFGFDL